MLEDDSEAQVAAQVVREWVIKADADLTAAEVLYAADDETLYNAICFHVQQCVEKYAKSLLALYQKPIPYTHNLAALFNLLPPHLRVIMTAEEQARLNDYAVSARYPGDDEPLTTADATSAIKLAKRVRAEVRTYLPRSAYKR